MTTGDDLLFLPAHRQLDLMRERALSPVELCQAYLGRISAIDGSYRGFVEVVGDIAMMQAQKAEDIYAKGEQGGLLLGLPTGVKDIIETKGIRTTYGSAVFADHIPDADATVVGRLADAGAVLLGKTNTFEFALTLPSPIHKGSFNPWDRGRVAGGSSNGSGTAVSAGLCSAALGTDTGGSIRNPASYVGIVGLKPTHGRVPIKGVGCLAWSMDTVGPMTRSVRDAALYLQALAGFDPEDPDSIDAPVPDYLAALDRSRSGLRVGIPDNFFPDRMDDAVAAAWHAAAGRLAEQGVEIVSVQLPALEQVLNIWGMLMGGEDNVWHEQTFATKLELYGPGPMNVVYPLRDMKATDYVKARRAQWALRKAMIESMEGVDVLLVPTTPTPAFTFAEAKTSIRCGAHLVDAGFATTGFTMPFNVTGQPSLAVPCGLSDTGLPLSVQIVGRPFDEEVVLQIGSLLEEATGWSCRPPAFM